MNSVDNMTKYGFLFDVDGCITPKNTQELHARADKQLFPWFKHIKKLNHPIAFITGRSYPFMKKTAPELFQEGYLCFFEYGWCNNYNGKHNIDSEVQHWRNHFISRLIPVLEKACKTAKIPFYQKETVLAPTDGSMWIEKKYTMISVATNTKISPHEVHSIIEKVISELFYEKPSLIINKHHLGIDLLPPKSSKRIGALKAKQILDPNDSVEKWFIFGDSEYDKEMCQAFSEGNTEFIFTRENASLDVLKKLRNIFYNHGYI
ncbi:MAG: HAD hydrolase family protein [Candidatus Hodarchaeota archaeon]